MRHTTLPLLLLALAACQPATLEMTEEDRVTIAAEVEQTARAWWAAWEAMDFERGMAYVAQGPDVVFVGDGGVLAGHDAVRDAWSEWAQRVMAQDIELLEVRTHVLTPEIAHTTVRISDVQTHAGGSVAPPFQSVETLVWVKRDGEWKVLLGHESMLQGFWQERLDYEAAHMP